MPRDGPWSSYWPPQEIQEALDPRFSSNPTPDGRARVRERAVLGTRPTGSRKTTTRVELERVMGQGMEYEGREALKGPPRNLVVDDEEEARLMPRKDGGEVLQWVTGSMETAALPAPLRTVIRRTEL